MELNPVHFEERLWRLNESGDFAATLNVATIILDMNYLDRHENPVTLDMIVAKYKAYMSWWENKFGDRDPKFIRNSDNLKTIYDFLSDNLYQQEWKSPPKIRDSYLFGRHSTEELTQSLKSFKDSLDVGK